MIVLRIEVVSHNPMDKVYLPTVKREKKKEIVFIGRYELVIFLDEAYLEHNHETYTQ